MIHLAEIRVPKPQNNSKNSGTNFFILFSGQESDALHGISPRPVKKLALKSGRTSRVTGSSLTPPDSPTGRKAK